MAKDNERLRRWQLAEAVLDAIAGGATLRQVAKAAGVHAATLCSWRQQDPTLELAFQDSYEDRRRQHRLPGGDLSHRERAPGGDRPRAGGGGRRAVATGLRRRLRGGQRRVAAGAAGDDLVP